MSDSDPRHIECLACGGKFVCCAQKIVECQCLEVQLTAEERTYIAERYSDCICNDCLRQLKQEYNALVK